MRQELVQPLKTLNPAKTCLYMLILLLLCTLLQAQTQDSPNDAGGAFDTYKEAKMSIYKKDWPHAEELLKGFDTRFPRSKYLDDSIYWLAYSRNQLSKDNRDISRAVALKKEAIAAVTLLLETCKESSWADDAIILRLNISADLVTLGAKEYKAYILATLETANESETDILVVALGALARIDARASVSFFDTILKQTKNAALREKIVFVLRNSNNEQLNALLNRSLLRKPRWIHRVEPIYPSGALRKKIQGDVVLEVVTGPDGHVEKATVLSGHQLLREAAVKAAMQWVHDPTPVDGKPASRVFTVTLNFEMY